MIQLTNPLARRERSLPRSSALLTLAAAAALLVGCSKTDQASPPPAASAAMPAASAAAPKLKVAFAYLGPVGDHGWTYAHDQARLAVVKEFGDKIETVFAENVPEGPDAERVMRDFVNQGAKLVFGTSYGYMEPMLKVAADSPDVKFEHATGFKSLPNMRTYDSRTYEGAYLAGVVAGKMTKSNVLGVVGSVPIPEVIRNIDAYTLGAQSVNPKVHTKVIWVNKWFDPPKEGEAAQTLINQGADVLLQNTDSSAVLQTAEKDGKYAFGWDSPMGSIAPKAHLGSAVINWAPYYKKSIQEALDGTWKSAGNTWWGVKEGAIDLVDVPDTVPADAKAALDKVRAGLKDGSFAIWKGPIVDNEGKTVLKAGTVADDDFLHGVNFFVKGVDAKVPGK